MYHLITYSRAVETDLFSENESTKMAVMFSPSL